MKTKLYIFKLKTPYDEGSSILFSALAQTEIEAKSLILNKVTNEIYNSELRKKFSDSDFSPVVYENGDVFIQLLGDIKLFTQ
jgi:hypothetical protein